jgi:hypothetical protein
MRCARLALRATFVTALAVTLGGCGGSGLEYDETLLASTAQSSGGRFHFVGEPTAVTSVLRDEVLPRWGCSRARRGRDRRLEFLGHDAQGDGASRLEPGRPEPP